MSWNPLLRRLSSACWISGSPSGFSFGRGLVLGIGAAPRPRYPPRPLGNRRSTPAASKAKVVRSASALPPPPASARRPRRCAARLCVRRGRRREQVWGRRASPGCGNRRSWNASIGRGQLGLGSKGYHAPRRPDTGPRPPPRWRRAPGTRPSASCASMLRQLAVGDQRGLEPRRALALGAQPLDRGAGEHGVEHARARARPPSPRGA